MLVSFLFVGTLDIRWNNVSSTTCSCLKERVYVERELSMAIHAIVPLRCIDFSRAAVPIRDHQRNLCLVDKFIGVKTGIFESFIQKTSEALQDFGRASLFEDTLSQ